MTNAPKCTFVPVTALAIGDRTGAGVVERIRTSKSGLTVYVTTTNGCTDAHSAREQVATFSGGEADVWA